MKTWIKALSVFAGSCVACCLIATCLGAGAPSFVSPGGVTVSTGLSDSSNLVRKDVANTISANGQVVGSLGATNNVIPLVVQCATSQSTDSFRVLHANGTVLFSVDSALGIVTTNYTILCGNNLLCPGLLWIGSTSTGLAQQSAGVLEINNGTGGGAAAGKLNALTVATLPGTPAIGMFAVVSDALVPVIGNTVASGGSAKAFVWYNGAAWTVMGK